MASILSTQFGHAPQGFLELTWQEYVAATGAPNRTPRRATSRLDISRYGMLIFTDPYVCNRFSNFVKNSMEQSISLAWLLLINAE